MKYVFFLSLPLYALDRVSKYLVVNNIDPNSPWPSGGARFFHLVNITNTGAAFGSFQNNNKLFIVISCVAALLALVLLVVHHRPIEIGATKSVWWTSNAWRNISLGLLLAGVLGNLTDRMLYGHVIDFLLFDFGSHVPSILHPFPAFNVADSCICVAVAFFIIHSYRVEKKAPETV